MVLALAVQGIKLEICDRFKKIIYFSMELAKARNLTLTLVEKCFFSEIEPNSPLTHQN